MSIWISKTYAYLVIKGIIQIQLKNQSEGIKSSKIEFIPDILDPDQITNDLTWLESKIVKSIEHRQNHDKSSTLKKQIFTLISMIVWSKSNINDPWSLVENRIIKSTSSKHWKSSISKCFFNLLREESFSISPSSREILEIEYSKFEEYFNKLLLEPEFFKFYEELLKLINQTLEEYVSFD